VDNPYKAPVTPLKEPSPAPRSPILAVLAGLLVDFGGTMLATVVIGIVYAVTLASRGMPPEQTVEAVTRAEPFSGYGLLTSIVGASLSVLGGYVCARIARRNERRVAAVQALLVSVLGALGGGATLGPLAHAGLVLLTFASVMAGGELGRRHNLAKAAGDLSAV
jgi:hypothetical protein